MTPPTTLELVDLPLAKLKPHPDNVRTRITIDREMVKSIEAQGILEPLLVLPANAKGEHLVVAGHRRRAHAMKAKGVTTAPCVVRDLTPLQVVETMMTENLQRADIDPIEEARGYARMVELEATAASIAAAVGRSARHVGDRIKLLQLPAKVLKSYQDHRGEGEWLSLDDLTAAVKYSQDAEAMDAWVAELAKARPDWQARSEAGRWLHNWCRDRDRQRARAKVLAEFESSGAKQYTKTFGYENRHRLDKLGAPALLEVLKLGGKTKAHADEPCHAVILEGFDQYSYRDPKMIPVCTHPIRHTSQAKAKDKSPVQMAAATYKGVPVRAARDTAGRQGPAPKLKQQMTEARFEHLRKVATGEISLDADQVLAMALAILRGRTGEATDVVGRIVDPEAKKGHGYTQGAQYLNDPEHLVPAVALLCAGAAFTDTWSGHLADYRDAIAAIALAASAPEHRDAASELLDAIATARHQARIDHRI